MKLCSDCDLKHIFFVLIYTYLLISLALQYPMGFWLSQCFYSALSLHCFLHPFIPIIWTSSISAIQLFVGLPLILVPIGFHSKIFLDVLLSSIRITWPSQTILLLFTNLTISAVKALCYKSEGRWFDLRLCQWIFHCHKILPIVL